MVERPRTRQGRVFPAYEENPPLTGAGLRVYNHTALPVRFRWRHGLGCVTTAGPLFVGQWGSYRPTGPVSI